MATDLSTLTGKQLKFVTRYLETNNGTASAEYAGYSAHSAPVIATKLLKHPVISQAIKEHQERVVEESGVTVEYVIQGLKKEAERVGPGASHNARVSSLGLLGKHIGMFKERIEHSGPGGGPVQFIMPASPTGDNPFEQIIDDEDDDT